MALSGSGVPSIEKRLIASAFLFAAVLLGLIAYSALGLGLRVPTCATLPPFTKSEVIQHAPDRFEVHLLTRMWQFSPSQIKVPKGSVVDFYATSEDVTHGFYIDRTNVNLMVLPNVVNYAQARFDKPGKYNVLCHEYCGLNHASMRAVVEVTESAAAQKTP